MEMLREKQRPYDLFETELVSGGDGVVQGGGSVELQGIEGG
jgi:hypothetical protein